MRWKREKNTQNELDKVFEKKKQIEAAVIKAKSEQQQREESAVSNFKAIREELIKPTMREFVSYLASKNCGATISEAEERLTGYAPSQRLEDAFIKLQFSPNDVSDIALSGHNGHLPYFTVRLDKSQSKVYFMYSTMWGNRGGQSSSHGHHDLKTLDKKKLEEAITKTIAAIIR